MANTADISFVHLGITIDHLQNSISIFGFRIAFYGIIIGFGILAGLWVATRDAKRRGQDPDIYLDFVLYAIIISIMGARIYYVLFDWDNYKLSFFYLADTGCLGLITGQIIGRWGNFFNCEAFGGYTDSLFAMRIRRALVNENMISRELLNHLIVKDGVEFIQVHPTFLYESVWNLCVLAFMLWYRKRKRFDGEMLFIYLLGYGLGRVWIEGLRTDQLIFFSTGIPVSQALSLILVVISTLVLFCKHRQIRKKSKGEVMI